MINITTPPIDIDSKHLLDAIHITLPRHNSLLVLGASKSGKTLFLNSLSERCPNSNFVTQNEELLPYLTVKQTLELSSKFTNTADSKVDEIITLLNLEKCQDTLVGDQALRGISGGEKKRVAIGCELMDKKIVIMDEPTNGLDSDSAALVCSLSKKGYQLICSLSQPSDELLKYFDQLLVLDSGHVKYYGPMKLAPETKFHLSEASSWIYESQFSPIINLEYSNFSHKKTDVSPNTNSQLATLLYRNFLKLKSYQRSLIGVFVFQILFAIFTGFFFYHLSYTVEGLRDRSSLLYYLLARVVVMGPSFIPFYSREKESFIRESEKKYYHAITYFLADVTARVPILFLETFCYNIIVYWVANLRQYVTTFLYFNLVVFLMYLFVYIMVFVLVFLIPNINLATYVIPIIPIIFLALSGFVISQSRVIAVISWIPYINPVWYAYKCLMLNEYGNSNNSYYLSIFNISHEDNRGYYILVIIGIIILWSGLSIVALYLSKRIKLNNKQYSPQIKQDIPENNTDIFHINTVNTLTWNNIGYDINGKNILNNISGQVLSGKLVALMGASGSGKSTLLDILCLRKYDGEIRGSILFNGIKFSRDKMRYISYSEQSPIHLNTATILEEMRFMSKCKNGLTEQEIWNLLKLFDLNTIANRRMDDLNNEESKKASVAIQLASNPQLLFLDEPLTGLDTLSATKIMYVLSLLARKKIGIICSIHQPAPEIIDKFDDILLLSQNGELSYFGPKSGLNYYQDYMLQSRDIKQNEIVVLKPIDVENQKAEKYAITFKQQFICNLQRMFRNIIIEKQSFFASLLLTIILGLTIGLILYQRPNDQIGIYEKFAALFYANVHSSLKSFSYVIIVFSDKTYYIRERRSKMYLASSFVLARLLSKLPEFLISSFVFSVIVYFMVGLESTLSGFFFFYLCLFCLELCVYSFSQMLAAIINNFLITTSLYGIISMLFMITTGFMRVPGHIPKYLKWTYWISFFHWFIESCMINEFEDKVIYCKTNQLINGTCQITTGSQVLSTLGIYKNLKYINIIVLLLQTAVFVSLIVVGYKIMHKRK